MITIAHVEFTHDTTVGVLHLLRVAIDNKDTRCDHGSSYVDGCSPSAYATCDQSDNDKSRDLVASDRAAGFGNLLHCHVGVPVPGTTVSGARFP
jgi:hypothetical protein